MIRIPKTSYHIFCNWTKLLLGTLFLCSCENHQKISLNQNLMIDTINISIGDSCLQTYTSLRNRVCEDKLYCFNKIQHSIDIFNLSTQKLSNQIKIEHEGANGITNIDAFCVYGDSIFIQNETSYTIINHQGKIIKKISREKLNNLIDNNEYSIFPTNITLSNFENLIFDNKHDELIIPINTVPPSNLKDKNCIATIDIKKEIVNLLPIYFPPTVTDKYYGKLSTAQILSKGDSIIYNFGNSSKIYIYNRRNKETYEYDIKSNFTDNLSEDLDKNVNTKKIFDHYLHSLFFHNIQYDPYRDCYYRIHTNKNNNPSAFNDKETFLTIINSNFEKTDEIKLPENTYPIYNISANGLIFFTMIGLQEDSFSYINLTTDNINKTTKNYTQLDTTQKSEQIIKEEKIKKTILPSSKHSKKDSIMTTDKINSFVRENMIYPQEELKQNIEGYVLIILESDSTGNVISHRISETGTTTDNENFRKEALRIAHLVKYIYPNITFFFHVPFLVDRYFETHKKES